MTSTMNNSLVLAVEDAVESGAVCEETSAALPEQTVETDERRRERWHALDGLLRVSFGAISPAYLFSSFPLDR